jgi:hypothetical protein
MTSLIADVVFFLCTAHVEGGQQTAAFVQDDQCRHHTKPHQLNSNRGETQGPAREWEQGRTAVELGHCHCSV